MKILKVRQLILRSVKFAIFFSLLSAVRPAFATFHIVLDPGHGGIDTGAVHSNIKEADLVLKVANKLKNLLEKNEIFQVTLTRTTDRNISLPERVKLAENSKADLFVSLHANAAADQRAKGVEFFFQNNLPPDEENLFLANKETGHDFIQENGVNVTSNNDNSNSNINALSKKNDIAAIIEDLHRQNRINSSLHLTQALTQIWGNDATASQATIKQAPFYVISKTSMPSVLIEVGFLTNPPEAKRLSSTDYQSDLAQKIYHALVAYKEKMDNSKAKTLN